MDSSPEASNIYAPPRAQSIAHSGPPTLRWRFWATCICFALATPALLFGLSVVSAWPRVLIFFMGWLAGAYWILLPHLRHQNRSELDLTYMACVAIGFPFCAGAVFAGLVIAALLFFFLLSILA